MKNERDALVAIQFQSSLKSGFNNSDIRNRIAGVWTRVCSICLIFSTSVGALAQDSTDINDVNVIKTLVELLDDEDVKVRQAAEDRLARIGAVAIEALRRSAQSANREVAERSQRILDRMRIVSPDDLKDLRALGQQSFWDGDYEKMTRHFRRLVHADDVSIDDARWLGHAGQLASRWEEAAAAYTVVIDRLGVILEHPSPKELAGNALKRQIDRATALQQHAATILLTARIQRFYLKDSIAAENTLLRILEFNDPFRESLERLEMQWQHHISENMVREGAGFFRMSFGDTTSRQIPLMALREFAVAQQLNGNNAGALDTWRRLQLNTRNYSHSEETIDAQSLERLIQNLPDSPDLSIPGVTLLDSDHPTAQFNVSDPATLSKSSSNSQNGWTFILAPRKGFEFESLEFTCDIEQQVLNHVGQFHCWSRVGEADSHESIGEIEWPEGKEPGRDKIARKFDIARGTGLVYFTAGLWKDVFKVHGVTVAATFRSRGKDQDAPKRPVPGFSMQTEFLPAGGQVTINDEPFGNEVFRSGMTPGRNLVQYSHPKWTESHQFSIDFQPGARYGLFVNLDSPFTNKLTNLRGIDFLYGHSTNVVQMPSGRYVFAWCHEGLRFVESSNLVNWSEPVMSSDAALFCENYQCICPTLYVDKTGLIWVAYFSNQLDIEQVTPGKYYLFLKSSKDGREWSAARPIQPFSEGWPPTRLQFMDGPDGKVWIFAGMQYAIVNTPVDLKGMANLEIPLTDDQRSSSRDPEATLDSSGRIHIVWAHSHEKLLYSQRTRQGNWTAPVVIMSQTNNRPLSYPHLFVKNDQAVLIYDSNQSSFLRRGLLNNADPKFGQPIKIASHIAPIGTFRPFITSNDTVAFLCGIDTVWMQSATMMALFAEKTD